MKKRYPTEDVKHQSLQTPRHLRLANYYVSDLSQQPTASYICLCPIEVFVSNVFLMCSLITNRRFGAGSVRVHSDSPRRE